MAQADSVPTPNHAPNPDAHAQQSTTKPRRIRVKPADRRYFIGGSDARVIMGEDQAALLRLGGEKKAGTPTPAISGHHHVPAPPSNQSASTRCALRRFRHTLSVCTRAIP